MGKITTVKQLEEEFPDLAEQIRKDTAAVLAEEIAAAPVDIVEKKFSKLVKKLREKIEHEVKSTPANLKIDGFLLETADPFAAAIARQYAKASGIDIPQLPMVLPYENKEATITALKSYCLRANGAGDKARAANATEALAKLGGDVTAKHSKA